MSMGASKTVSGVQVDLFWLVLMIVTALLVLIGIFHGDLAETWRNGTLF